MGCSPGFEPTAIATRKTNGKTTNRLSLTNVEGPKEDESSMEKWRLRVIVKEKPLRYWKTSLETETPQKWRQNPFKNPRKYIKHHKNTTQNNTKNASTTQRVLFWWFNQWVFWYMKPTKQHPLGGPSGSFLPFYICPASTVTSRWLWTVAPPAAATVPPSAGTSAAKGEAVEGKGGDRIFTKGLSVISKKTAI